MIKRKEFWWTLISMTALLVAMAQSSRALSLDEYLAIVAQKHGGLKALDASKEAAEGRKTSQEIDLSPVLTLSGSYLDDKKTTASSPTYLINHNEVRSYSLGLAKKFVSGTQLQVSTTAQQINTDYTNSGTGGAAQVGVGAAALSFSQSLWKDSFGVGTRKKVERQKLTADLEQQGYDLQAQQLLIDAEAAYWDLIYQQNEVELRSSSLERAKRIETWVKQRYGNGIGDKADVLNAQGLLATRELQLVMSQDDLKAAQQKVIDILELKKGDSLPELKGDMNSRRDLTSYLGGQKTGRVLRLDSYLSVIESKAKALVADEVVESMKPDLSLSGSYQTNAYVYGEGVTSGFNQATKTDKPTAYVALQLTWLLDGDVKNANRNAAKKDALAAALRQERKLLESESTWSEIQRRYSELSKKIELAAKISRVQTDKAAAERDKLSKGRSITSQVITAEQDAAEAELTLSKLKVEQRKLEVQGRLFVKVGDK